MHVDFVRIQPRMLLVLCEWLSRGLLDRSRNPPRKVSIKNLFPLHTPANTLRPGFFSLSRYYRKDPSFIPSFPIEGSLELYKTPLQNDDVKDEDDSSGTSDRDDNETPSTSTTFTPYRTDIFSLLPDQHSFTQSNDFLSPDIPPIGRASHRPLPPPLTVTPSAPPRLSSDDEQSQASSPAEPQSPTSFENMLMFPPNMTLPQQIHPPMALPPNIITSIMRPSANYFAPSAAIDESGVVTRVPTVPHPHYHQSQPCVQYGVMAPPHPLARNDEPHLSEMTHTFPYAMMYSLPPSGADHHADPGSAFPSVFNGDAGMSGAQYSWPVSRHQPPW